MQEIPCQAVREHIVQEKQIRFFFEGSVEKEAVRRYTERK
jgi:hypothetical protein